MHLRLERAVRSHGGEVSGFTANNTVYPDQRAAVVVLTNLDATSTSSQLAARIGNIVFASDDSNAAAALEQAKAIFEGLQQGRIDRSLFTSNANAYFSDQALADFASSLGPLGKPQAFVQQSQSLRGGMRHHAEPPVLWHDLQLRELRSEGVDARYRLAIPPPRISCQRSTPRGPEVQPADAFNSPDGEALRTVVWRTIPEVG